MGIFSSLAETFSTPNPAQTPRSTNPYVVTTPSDLNLDNLYTPTPSNWYTAKPYGFKMNMRSGQHFVMFLPISPSNLNITTQFATNIIPTLYGTVEEHSDIRYYDIVIEGNTAMVPKFVTPGHTQDVDIAYDSLLQTDRSKFKINSNVALGGFFSNTIGQISNILNQANKAVQAITGNTQPIETGVYTNQTGYAAFHNLARFLMRYKKDASGSPDNNGNQANQQAFQQHPLTFFNYKDGNEYDVAIQNFILRRTVENPMLYYYQITMRAYNIRPSGGLKSLEDINQRLIDLGLDGVKASSLLSTIKDISNSAKAVVGSAVNGVNLFGR